MKKIALLLLCLTFISTQNVNAIVNNDVKKEAGYISVAGNMHKEVEPDMATITFAVENVANTALEATKENNNISTKVVEALKAIAIENKDVVKTNSYSVRPNYAKNNEVKKYTAVNSITVITKNIQSIPKFIDVAISNGANRTNNLYYELEDSKSVCSELYPNVIKDLKETALAIATAADTKLDGIKNVSVSCNSDGRYASRKYLMNSDSHIMAEGGQLAPIEAGKIKISVYVNANFYVK